MKKKVVPGGFPFGKEKFPLIAVPMTATSPMELEVQLKGGIRSGAELLEWRGDYFSPEDWEQGLTLLKKNSSLPFLITLRTSKEGGLFDGSVEEYQQFCQMAIASGAASLIDIELSCGEETSVFLSKFAQEHQVGTVFSCHNFQQTLPAHQLTSIFEQMERCGADIAKIAMMPQSSQDVLTLMEQTLEFHQRSEVWTVAMSMSDLGKVTRVAGELFGSAITFATVTEGSAPGQMEIQAVRSMIEQLHF